MKRFAKIAHKVRLTTETDLIPRTWPVTHEHIDSLALLAPGWDSHGGRSAIPEHVAAAHRQATAMEALGFPMPTVTLCSDGTLCFEWMDANHHHITLSSDEDV